MKKNSNRQIKDYSKFDATHREFYGLLIKNGVVRIDPKRFIKTVNIDQHIYKEMNKPRKTVYFIPQKVKRDDYMSNIFKSEINDLERFWEKEFVHALRAIKTPKEAHKKAMRGHFIQTGILDYDEVTIHANMSQLERSNEYNFIMKSMVAQFIHQIASTIEATTIRVITLQGYNKKKFNRDLLDSFIQGKKTGISLETIEGYSDYDQLYDVWNFLKHNSIDLYDKIKKKYPELLNSEEYENGDLALCVLNIDRTYVSTILKKLKVFFDNVCEKAFQEDVLNADWNYNEFFINKVDSCIEAITNPLGLPWYI